MEDFSRLLDRINPVTADGNSPKDTIHRALHFGSLKNFVAVKKMLDNPRPGETAAFYTAQPNVMGESWSNNEATANRFADKKNNIILHCSKYKSRKRIDGIYRQVEKNRSNPDKEIFGKSILTEGESIMPAHVRFRVVKYLGRKKINSVAMITTIKLRKTDKDSIVTRRIIFHNLPVPIRHILIIMKRQRGAMSRHFNLLHPLVSFSHRVKTGLNMILFPYNQSLFKLLRRFVKLPFVNIPRLAFHAGILTP